MAIAPRRIGRPIHFGSMGFIDFLRFSSHSTAAIGTWYGRRTLSFAQDRRTEQGTAITIEDAEFMMSFYCAFNQDSATRAPMTLCHFGPALFKPGKPSLLMLGIYSAIYKPVSCICSS
jgi:hypothetical protein